MKNNIEYDAAFFYKREIKKVINAAMIDYQYNPAFVSFRILTKNGVIYAFNKLISEGYSVSKIGNQYLKVSI